MTKNAHKLADVLTAKVSAFPSLAPKDLFHLVSGFGFLHLLPHSELLFLVEPYVLHCLPQFTADELNYLAAFYIRLQRGSQPFLQQMMAHAALQQEKAGVQSQVQLLSVTDAKTLNRKEFKVDFTKEVRLIAKAIVKNINSLGRGQVPVVVPRLIQYQVGNKAYYEMLAIEFTKHHEDYSFKQKTRLLYWFALADIDPQFIMKTATKLCNAYTEAFIQRMHSTETPMFGLFTD